MGVAGLRSSTRHLCFHSLPSLQAARPAAAQAPPTLSAAGALPIYEHSSWIMLPFAVEAPFPPAPRVIDKNAELEVCKIEGFRFSSLQETHLEEIYECANRSPLGRIPKPANKGAR